MMYDNQDILLLLIIIKAEITINILVP